MMNLNLNRKAVIAPWLQLAEIVVSQVVGRGKRVDLDRPPQMLCQA
jgi:hypothetical protein